MKTRIFSLLAALAALVIVPQASAQNVSAVDFGIATVLTNNATRTVANGGIIKIDRQQSVGLVIRFTGPDSGTDNVVVTLARSADGSVFETSPPSTLSFTNAQNGATAVVGYHQIPATVIGSAHSVKILSIANASSADSMTAASVAIVKKAE